MRVVRSVGLGWEAQFRQISDKRMSNDENAFTWTHFRSWIYHQNYLTGRYATRQSSSIHVISPCRIRADVEPLSWFVATLLLPPKARKPLFLLTAFRAH